MEDIIEQLGGVRNEYNKIKNLMEYTTKKYTIKNKMIKRIKKIITCQM